MRSKPFQVLRVVLFVALATSYAAGQVGDYCTSVANGLAHADAFENFCTWVVSFDTKLPNIIGDQETRRYHTENGKDAKLVDTTGAKIAYIDSRPHISDVTINRVKIPQNGELPDTLQLYGAWSYGDYGSDLRLLFGSNTYTHFSYGGESSLNGTRVFVFFYDVPRTENHRWQMGAREKAGARMQETFPGFRGRVVLDAQTFALIRFERMTTDVDKHFPLRFGSNQVGYKLLPLGDGTSFVLPVESIVTFCHDEKRHHCELNDTTFENWQKFGAKSRILTGTQPE